MLKNKIYREYLVPHRVQVVLEVNRLAELGLVEVHHHVGVSPVAPCDVEEAAVGVGEVLGLDNVDLEGAMEEVGLLLVLEHVVRPEVIFRNRDCRGRAAEEAGEHSLRFWKCLFCFSQCSCYGCSARRR